MKKIESVVIKSIIWSVPPFLFFILFWWILASLNIFQIFIISNTFIAISAFSGLLFGFGFVIITHKYLYNEFYKLPFKYLTLIYIFLSSVGFAFMMGVPICIILLGVVSGIYIGRRSYYSDGIQRIIFRRASLFTSIVTSFWIFFISILAKGDGEVIKLIERNTSLTESIISGPIGIVLIIIVTGVFGIIQFYLTFISCKLSYKFES